MRFLTLSLKAIGPFTEGEIDFGDPPAGLHLIYGPNEAGKSSTLRALKHLLFGFPSLKTKVGRTLGDSFLHPAGNLRVGARLKSDSGEILSVVRRMAASQSLRGEDDSTPVDEAILRQMLGQIDASTFETFFGIDHQRLVEGGRAILAGQGDVGQILVSASGIGDMRVTQKAIEKEYAELFLPQGRNPIVNALLSDLKAREKESKDLSLPAKSWEEQQESLQAALKRKADLEQRLEEATKIRARLRRFIAALPLLPEWDRWQAECAELQNVVLLKADFSKRRQQWSQEQAAEQAKLRRSEQALEPLRQQLASVRIDEPLIAQQAAIEPLREAAGVYRQALADRPKLIAKLKVEERRAQDALQAVDRALSLDEAKSLRLTESQREQIRKLGSRYQTLLQQKEDADEAVATLTAERESARRRQASGAKPLDASPLRAALSSAGRAGDLDQQCADAAQAVQRAEARLLRDVSRLPFWNGTVEQARALPAPPVETIERFEQELLEIDADSQRLQERLEEIRRQHDELDTALRAMRESQAIPTLEDLESARRHRQKVWAELPWKADAEISDDFRKQRIERYEAAVVAADTIADRMRQDADRVALYAERQHQKNRLASDLQRLSAEAESHRERADAKRAQWRQLWAPTGIEPRTPREMRMFHRKHAEFLSACDEQEELASRLAASESQRAQQIAALMHSLRAVTDQSEPPPQRLAEALARAELVLEQLDRQERERLELERDLHRIEKDLSGAERRCEKAARDLETWQARWNEALKALPVSPQASPDSIAADIDRLSLAQQELTLAGDTRSRVDEIDESCRRFEGDVRQLAERLAPPLATVPPDQAAGELHARLAEALRQQREQRLLEKKQRDEEQASVDARSRLAAIDEALAQLVQEARCGTVDGLADAEEQSQRRQRAVEKRDDLENRLKELAGGQPLVEFLAEARALDPDTTAAAVARRDAEIEELNHELKNELGETIGALKKTLGETSSAGKAAEAAEAARDIALRLSGEAERYVRARLAAAVLKAAIERYRERHQGPILGRASDIFARLTCGSFRGLRQDFTEDGQPVLVGIRAANGAVVHVEGMSDGTADQIYLAVRLAWLEEYLQTHESLPLIVDDILIRFDDERAIETLRALAELSQKTQVLFFTHHDHLIERARQALGQSAVIAHRLPRSHAYDSRGEDSSPDRPSASAAASGESLFEMAAPSSSPLKSKRR